MRNDINSGQLKVSFKINGGIESGGTALIEWIFSNKKENVSLLNNKGSINYL